MSRSLKSSVIQHGALSLPMPIFWRLRNVLWCLMLVIWLGPAKGDQGNPPSGTKRDASSVVQDREAAPDSLQQEFRVVWGGTSSRHYQGTISIDNGRLLLVRNLSVRPASAGTVVQRDSQSVSLLDAAETTFGGVDLVVDGNSSSTLQIEIKDSPAGPGSVYQLALSELQRDIWVGSLSGTSCRIAIERQAFDKLRVQDDRVSKIFECGEDWPLRISGFRTGLAGGDYQLILNWAGRRSLSNLASVPVRLDANGDFPMVDVAIKVPMSEGGHRLEISLSRNSMVQALAFQKPLLTRSLELVTLANSPTTRTLAGWRPLLAIDTVAATKTGNLSWLASFAQSPLSPRGLEIVELPSFSELSSPEQWNRLLSLGKSITSHGPVGRGGSIEVRDFPMQTGPSEAEPTHRCVSIYPGAWLALPLSNLQPGVPHRLRIEVPTDQAGMLSLTIKDSAETDQVAISPQHTIYLPEASSTSAGESITHEILFWPRSESVQILLSSGHRTRPASVGKILVETAQFNSNRKKSPGEERESSERIDSAERQEPATPGRMIGMYIDQPFLADCLAAPRERDSKTGRSLETWETWQAVAERIGLHLELSGANTLFLLAAGDGGSLFPVQSLQTVPWLNKSTFFTDGRAPNGHDFLELLLRHLDRSGMRLVIELDLNTGLSLPSQKKLTLAHPEVQLAVTEVVQEVLQRYHQFPALAGISLRLRPNSHLLLSSEQDGFPLDLIQQYANERDLKLPDNPDQFLDSLDEVTRAAYLNWRAEQLTKFYTQLTLEVQKINSGLKLYLNTIRLWGPLESDLQNSNHSVAIRHPQQYLLGHGLDLEKLSALEGLVITQGSVKIGTVPLSSKEWARMATADSGVVLSSSAMQAALVTHQPRLGSLGQQSSDDPDQDMENGKSVSVRKVYSRASTEKAAFNTRQHVDSTTTGAWARQTLLEQILRSDQQLIAFGGWYPVWTLEPLVKEFVETFKTLPPIVLQDLPLLGAEIPIRVRRGQFNGRDYIVLINASTADCGLTLQLDSSEVPPFALLGASSPESLMAAEREMAVSLAAGKMLAWAWEGKGPNITSAKLTPSQKAIAEIAQGMQRLESSLAKASDAGSQRVLLHSSGTFEQWQEESKPVGWNLSSLPKTMITRVQELPHSGQSCVLMENFNRDPVAAWIQSHDIELPTTGRLTVRAWLRSSAADHRQPLVRVSLTGRVRNGNRYSQSVYYGGAESGKRPIANDWGRRPAELHVSDIPIDDLVELHVAIDLIGEGRIWVDDVEVIETWLHPEERNHLRGQLMVAKQKLAENNPFPAEKLLRSQWNWYLKELESSQILNPVVREPAQRSSPSLSPAWNQPKTAFQQWRENWLDRWQR